MSKYHEPKEHINIYEVPLTIKVNPMWYYFRNVNPRQNIYKVSLNSMKNEIKRLFNLNKCLTSRKKSINNEIK